MDLFTQTHWRTLAEKDEFPCVSLYLPTVRSGSDVRQNAIRCRNLLDEAEQQLLEHSIRGTDATSILAEARDLLRQDRYWQHQSDGLAIFLARGLTQMFRVPLPLKDLVVVNHRFHLKPLAALLEGDGRFYVLALSLNGVRLMEGNRFSLQEIDVPSLPKNLQEALNIDEYQDSLQYFSFQPTSVSNAVDGRGQAMFHGHGGADQGQRKRDEVRQFFVRLNRGLDEFFTVERAPLVFAGVEYLFAMFREACHYKQIVDKPIVGSPSIQEAWQLHGPAWQLVAPLFAKERDARLERLGAQLGTGLASQQLETVVMGARQGAVDALFVPQDTQCWGTVDEQSGEIRVHDKRQANDEDLLDHAATHTLLNSGLVYTLPSAEMPQGAHVAALFRYPVTPTIHTNAGRH